MLLQKKFCEHLNFELFCRYLRFSPPTCIDDDLDDEICFGSFDFNIHCMPSCGGAYTVASVTSFMFKS